MQEMNNHETVPVLPLHLLLLLPHQCNWAIDLLPPQFYLDNANTRNAQHPIAQASCLIVLEALYKLLAKRKAEVIVVKIR